MKVSIVYKYSAMTVALVVITVAILSWFFYAKTSELLINKVLNEISSDIRATGDRLSAYIEVQNKDILFLANAEPIQAYIRAESPTVDEQTNSMSLSQWKQLSESILHSMLSSNPNYLKIRLIDIAGQEKIVVGREKNGGEISILRDSNLQNKAHRDYVKDTLKLAENEVYLSEINLNREFGKVSIPYVEVLRSATPLFNKQTGQRYGVLLLSVEVGHQLESIQKRFSQSGRKIYISNDHGSFLLHPDDTKTYGFDLGRRYRVQEYFPQLAHLFLPENNNITGILMPEDIGGTDVIEFTKVYFAPNNSERFIAIGFSQNYRDTLRFDESTLNNMLVMAVVIAVFVTLMAMFFSYHLTLPIKKLTDSMVDYSKGKTTTPLPKTQNDEVGLLIDSYHDLIADVESATLDLKFANKNLEASIAERTNALKINEKKQRAIVENIVDALITIDEKGIIESFNPAAVSMFGYQPEEIIGKNIKLLMPEPYQTEHDGYIQNYHKTGKKRVIGTGREVEALRKDGSTFAAELSVSEIVIGDSKLFTGLIRDISERKQMDVMKNEFISTVSHELRTPLTSIRGSLGLLSSGTVGELPESAAQMLKIASNNTERLLLLINDILDIQKIESGKMSFRFERLQLKPFIEQAILDHADYGTQHGVSYVTSHILDDVTVYADKDRLMQVMGNLLSNAAKFSHQDDTVEISVARHPDGRVRISVTDYGTGIPEEFQPKLFERFTQSDSSDRRAKGGTGLGLSISKVIMEKHGGLIDFISKEGIGSTFYIELPEVIGSENKLDEAPSSLSDDVSACVLIIEDDPDIAALIRRMLAEAGYNSDIAYDAAQARQLLTQRAHNYQLITLDIILPDEDGISLITDLRKDPKLSDIPVVVLSIKANETKRELEGGALDIADWLNKPIDHERLVHVVTSIVGQNEPPRVLHIEDEEDVHRVVKQMLKDECELLWKTTVNESRELINQGNLDLILLDIGLPDGSGLDLLEDIEKLDPQPKVIIFSAMDVSDEYANRVNAVLVKSKTNNEKLLNILIHAMQS